ncbi:hypothetical protein ABT156_16475, partial [Streptomyces sp. NPDC001833]
MSGESRHAPIPGRPSPDHTPTEPPGEPAPAADGTRPGNGGTGRSDVPHTAHASGRSDRPGNGSTGRGDVPDPADASRRADRPGFFDLPTRMNRSQRPDVSTGGGGATGQDQLPGRPGGQQSRDDRTSRGGAVGQVEQGTGDRAVGRSTSAERIVRPRHPSLRPPQGRPPQDASSASPPPPASARFPDTPPAPAGREPGRAVPPTPSAFFGAETGGEGSRRGPSTSSDREPGRAVPPVSPGRETGRTAPFRLSYGAGPSRRADSGS